MKRNDFKLLVEGWRDYINKVEGGFGIISERGFYGGKSGYVTTRTMIPSDAVFIIDDYGSLFRGVISMGYVGSDSEFYGITKDFANEDRVIECLKKRINRVYSYSYEENSDIAEAIIDARFDLYREKFGSDIFSNDKTIFFDVGLMNNSDLSALIGNQSPNIDDEYNDMHIDFNENNIDEIVDQRMKDVIINTNWKLHDMGHTIQYLLEEEGGDNPPNINGEEIYDIQEVYDLIGIDDLLTPQGGQYLGGREFESELGSVFYLNEFPLIKKTTPGAGKFDTEYSFLSIVLRDPSENGINRLISELVGYIKSIYDKIDDDAKDKFNLEGEFDDDFPTLQQNFRNIFQTYTKLMERLLDKFKVISVR